MLPVFSRLPFARVYAPHYPALVARAAAQALSGHGAINMLVTDGAVPGAFPGNCGASWTSSFYGTYDVDSLYWVGFGANSMYLFRGTYATSHPSYTLLSGFDIPRRLSINYAFVLAVGPTTTPTVATPVWPDGSTGCINSVMMTWSYYYSTPHCGPFQQVLNPSGSLVSSTSSVADIMPKSVNL